MSDKRALIVDDSKTAQLRLRKMLLRYDLQIDLAGSAEEALSYLSYQNPAVIFLDHLMPGMDGFEALKIIKANPHTATVPIVMYTSKSGDVYMSQARALGAIGVLSKDVIEPSSIEKVMNAINMMPKPAEGEDIAVPSVGSSFKNIVSPVEQAAVPGRPSADTLALVASQITTVSQAAQAEQASQSQQRVSGKSASQASPSDDVECVKQHLSRVIELNVIKIRQEVSGQNRFLFKRMMHELKDIKNIKERALSKQTPTVVEPLPISVDEKQRSIIPDLIIVAVLLIIAFQVFSIRNIQRESDQRFQEFQAVLEKSASRLKNIADKSNILPSNDPETAAKLWSAIEWSLNLNNQFEFGEQALSDKRLNLVRELVSRLQATKFKGVVLLAVNHGDFCVLPTTMGDFVLPADETSAQNCEPFSVYNNDYSLQDQMSLAFVNFINSSPLLSEDSIQIDLKTYGTSRPKFSYPDPTVSAGRWNQVARLNNRVDISLLPKSPAYN